MYKYIIIKLYYTVDEILDTEGDLNSESDVSDIDMNEVKT